MNTGLPCTGVRDFGTNAENNCERNHPESRFSLGGSFSDEEPLLKESETRLSSVESHQSVSMNFPSENSAFSNSTDHDSGPLLTSLVNTNQNNGLAGTQSVLSKIQWTRPKTATELEEGLCEFCAEGSCHKHMELRMHSRHRPDSLQSLPERNATPLSPVFDFTMAESESDVQDGVPLVILVEAPASAATSTFWFCNISKREKLILLCLVLICFMTHMCLSIMAPFFPAEAESKGVSITMSGWIFGTFALVQVVSSPIFGKLLPVIGSRFLIISGQFFAGGCLILFGFLDYIEPEQNVVFIALCFVLRVALAVGCTAALTASYAVTAVCFPANVSVVFGFLEAAIGMGLMLGPALGGILNQVCGYMSSFAVVGGIMIVTVPVQLYCLPADDCWSCFGMVIGLLLKILGGCVANFSGAILRIPGIIVVCLAVITSGAMWSILDPTLSVQLNHEFALSPSMIGLLFLLMSCVYAICSPIWGALADRTSDSSPMMVFGFGLAGVGLLLLGPSPFFKVEGALWLTILALIVFGASVSLALVPTFDKILDAIEKAGYQDDLSVFSLVAGVWGACLAIGDFLGPAIGGWLMDTAGFPLMMTYTACTCAFMVVVLLAFILYERKCQTTTSSDSDPSPTSDPDVRVTETTPLISHLDNNGDGTNGLLSTMNVPETL